MRKVCMSNIGRRRAMLSMALALLTVSASASSEPSLKGPVKVVLPFGPGSGTDTYARLVARKLGPALGTTVIVENKPGASGIIAAETVARAAPDGNTLLFTTNTTHAANPNMYKQLAYDPVKDFAPISKLGNLTFLLVVPADSPYHNLDELIAAARTKPGHISFGASNSFGTVSGFKLGKITGTQFLHIPYKSSPQIIADMLGGLVNFAFVDVTAATPMLNSGRLRALAVLAEERFPTLRSVPIMKELGYPQFDVVAWFGMFAPAGTPAPIVEEINSKLVAVLQDSALRERGAELGLEIFGSSPAELADYVEAQVDLWKILTADAGLTKQ